MSKRSSNTAEMGSGFDTLETGRLTWVGLAVAAVGWVLLLGEAVLASKGPRPPFHADLFDIAKCIVASGFALAVIGALRTGFGTLNRFFGAVLTRSARRDSDTDRGPVASSAAERQRQSAAPIERRPYRILADGSVEVETILGTRVFKTMAEARDFI